MAGGVKPIFTDPEALREKINDYFDGLPKRDENGEEIWVRPPTLAGLAGHLGVTRRTLTNYISDYESGAGKRGKGKAAECGQLLTQAKSQIETFLEEELVTRSKTTGIQFALMNGYGWGQKQTVDVQGSMQTEVKAEVSTPVSRLSDEELLNRLTVLQARASEIMQREGLSGADG